MAAKAERQTRWQQRQPRHQPGVGGQRGERLNKEWERRWQEGKGQRQGKEHHGTVEGEAGCTAATDINRPPTGSRLLSILLPQLNQRRKKNHRNTGYHYGY